MYLNLEYNFINYMTNNVKLYIVFFCCLMPLLHRPRDQLTIILPTTGR